MNRVRLLYYTLAMLPAFALPAHAQTAGVRDRAGLDLELRGAADVFSAEEAETAEPGAGDLDGENEERDLRRGIAFGDEIEPISTSGRVRPVQPFAERLRAVSRRLASSGSQGGGEDDGVFGGDTTRDRAIGFRAGSFLFFPELYTAFGWSDNAAGTAGGEPDSFYRVNPRLDARSDWSRHELGVSLRGGYTGYTDEPIDDDPFFDGNADLRLDLSQSTELDGSARYGFAREERGTAESSGGDQDIHEIGGTLAISRDVGLLGVQLRGDIDHTAYTGASTSGDRDNTVYAATLRLDADTGATLAPFVSASGLRRIYTEACDDPVSCEDRNATGYALRGGVTIDTGPKLRGEIGIGWREERPGDDALENLEGLLVDGSMIWSPTRLTTVTASVATAFEATGISGASGSIVYAGDLLLSHSFSDSLVGEAGVGYSLRRYEGIFLDERNTMATAALIWAFSDTIALQTRYTYRHFDTTTNGGDYDVNTIEAGLRFRH
ncbi:outer membrane beta-barrel protein [Rhizobiales bacterium]|uniref:outer membrane beta-barrel protein n=1 Tax=Hongsoonwoonella zoysiae TaxID=2821844 RepID=UPI00156121B1|nr:outer membrane beta-barrel protein [Hongsoonwoonella zoysiae]NRG17300.1 outer membrane beta-barrel protein [Hongsoonwoonella zoysiae]